MNSALKFLCFVTFSSLLVNKAYSEPRATEAALICTNTSAPPTDRQVFVANFLAALDILTPLVSRQTFGTSVVNGTANTTVYAYGECMKDLSRNDCNLCFAQCKTQILRCLPFQRLIRGGRLFYDGCYLRYDDYMFFNESLTPIQRTVCARDDFVGNHSLFRGNIVDLMRNLSVEAPNNDGFFVGSLSRGNLSVYGLAQCWEFVSRSDCARCLQSSLSNITSCPPKEEGRVLNSGCYLRYSTQRFYNNTDSDSGTGNGRSNRLAVSLAACSGVVAVLLFAATVLFFIRQRVEKQRREKKQLGSLLVIVNNSKLNFSYETLEKATNYFHATNKLGQGGSGSVYKGILPDGRTVAIKRLMFNTRQWVDHFFNEVNLISNIHHKNLVMLLGCSITGPESLLVYEYVANQSLHDHLFGKNKGNLLLSWEARHKIVLGTAEGLAYLHEESQFRIIHRDIKLSNVLLDDDFSPKIADFGLARLFPEDKTHISTAIAGTLGYMAPEYVVRGKLTEKADVYSFGILVIEVLSGKRNNAFSQNSASILETVWNLYGTGRICEAIDASLEGNFKEDEASRLLQIGLLCAQASAELRPSMSKVVKMLVDMDESIPAPAQPPFLNTGSGEVISPFYEPRTYVSQGESNTQSSGNSMTQSWIEPR